MRISDWSSDVCSSDLLDSFRIAGGLMLFWIAFEMVFEKRTQRREQRAEKVAADPLTEDVSVFPMAMPMLAGPGAIASIMLLMSGAKGTGQTLRSDERRVGNALVSPCRSRG